jgi:immune inhibitor A
MFRIRKTNLGARRSREFFTAAVMALAILYWAPLPAMPPHPDVVDKIDSGEIEEPYYLQNKEALKAAGVNTGGLSILLNKAAFAKPGISGNFNILTLLVDFSDNVASVATADFDTLVYVDITGSVNNFYRENSYNNLSIVSPVYPSSLGWYRAPQTYSYYVNNQNGLGSYPQNCQKLVEDLVDLADPYVDFSQFDNDSDGYVDGLIVAHSGPGAEFTGSSADIWSHQWGITPRLKDGVYISTYSINPEYWLSPGDITLGVYSHELGHVLGLPDLYDTDYSSYGVGSWSLMASGSWNGPLGASPSHFDAWSKIFLGFVTPTVPGFDQTGVSFPQVETNPTIYKLWTGGSPGTEYFLVENRQQTGYDAFLPSSGMLIWHIDEERSDNRSEWWPGSGFPGHYKVALEQADNLWELEKYIDNGDTGDPYPGSSVNRTFSGVSLPNSDSYAGTPTSVLVVNISNSSSTMTADIAVGSPQGIEGEEVMLPVDVKLLGNSPNPFNPETVIRIEVSLATSVKLEIYGLMGERITILEDGEMQPGHYQVVWDGKDSRRREVSSGVYFCRLESPHFSESIKMLKLK